MTTAFAAVEGLTTAVSDSDVFVATVRVMLGEVPANVRAGRTDTVTTALSCSELVDVAPARRRNRLVFETATAWWKTPPGGVGSENTGSKGPPATDSSRMRVA